MKVKVSREFEEELIQDVEVAQAKESWRLRPKMRAVLVDWLVEVHHQVQLLQESLHLTVAILDRYLSSSSAHNTKIKRIELQLVGVTAMFIASKYEEMFCLEVADFNYFINTDIIKSMENILSSLDFRLGRPLSLDIESASVHGIRSRGARGDSDQPRQSRGHCKR